MSNATVVGKVEKIHQKAAPEKATRQKGPPLCAHSGKGYADINHSERRLQQFACGDCGARLRIADEDMKKDTVIVPKHQVPEDVHGFRKQLERLEKTSHR